jgi:excisionase family DNA binding protein
VREDDRVNREMQLVVGLPEPLLDALAERVALLVLERMEQTESTPWMDVEAAAAYLGFSRDRMYKLTAASAIPYRRQPGGQRLIFHRDELDRWLKAAWERHGRQG